MTDATLTERYVAAVVRALPPRSRADVERELRASIADDLDARVAAGDDPAAAETAVLTALGDPARLAASYSGRPLHLIGPAFYLMWRRLLLLLLGIVLPFVAGGVILGLSLSEAAPGKIAVDTLWAVVGTAGGLIFWVTAVFAVLERVDRGRQTVLDWTLDELPEPPSTGQSGVGELVSGLLAFLVIAGGILWQQLASPFSTEQGEPIPLLEPALWGWWLPYFMGVALAELLFAIVLYRRRAWSLGTAVANIVLNLALAVPLIVLLARDQLMNPAFSAALIDVAGDSMVEVGGILSTIVIISVGAAALWDCVDGVLKAARASRPRT